VDTKPLYLQTGSKEIKNRVNKALELWEECTICPRLCRVNRGVEEKGACLAGSRVKLASHGPHYGEESVLTGKGGSGTIFFMHCNLECIFCQNWSISRGAERGEEISTEELAGIMLQLQKRGCHNINLVTPTPFLPLILEAVHRAVDEGLTLPLVYNCGGYENPDTLKLLDGIVDIYLPDAKYACPETALKHSGIHHYPHFLKESLKEMHRQVGDLQVERGTAYRGLLVRHLVLPEDLAGTEELVKFLAQDISPRTAVNIMDQYYPAYQASEYPALNRRTSRSEYLRAVEKAQKEGLRVTR